MGFTGSRMTRSQASPMDQLITARSAAAATSGMVVDYSTVSGLPAVQAAVEFSAEAVAQLSLAVWRGNPRVRADDTWQGRLFLERPNLIQDEFEFLHTIQASLEYRNSAYVWKTKDDAGRVIARTALHPGQVDPRPAKGGGLVYDVYFLEGFPTPPDIRSYGKVPSVGTDTIIHLRGRGCSGELIPQTPIQKFRKALGLAVGKQEHESSLLANGAGHGLLLSFPAGTKQDEADTWRDRFDARHAGPTKAGRTKVIGGGATVSTISMTQADAQFVESVELSLRDSCLIFHAPLWLIGQPGKSAMMVNPEHEMQRWLYFYLGPRLSRIESAFNADPDLFGTPDLRCLFDTGDVIRGDLQTEDAIAHQQIQDGRLLVDEWRIAHGRDPLPDGAGMIPQITPVGGAPNAPVTPPAQSPQGQEPDEDEE